LDFQGLPLLNQSIAGWILVYVGVSIGIGLVAGGISGLLLHFIGNRELRGNNQDVFSLNYGLNNFNPEIFEEDLDFTTGY
jgi:hypothetical protein